MKTQKPLVAGVLTLGLLISVLASGRSEAKSGSSKKAAATEKISPSESKTTAGSAIYYVVAQTSTQYVLSDEEPEGCGEGNNFPCKITSATSLPDTVAKATVDSNPNVTINDRRESL